MYSGDEPMYKQVRNIILRNIDDGTWPLHSKIKDEISLAEDLGVSRGTLRKAIKDFIDQGVLTRIRGKGTYVVSASIEHPLASRLVSFAESMQKSGINYKTIVLRKDCIQPDIKTRAMLELEEDEKVYLIERVRLVENTPVIYLKNYLPEHFFKGLIDEDLANNTIFHLIENKYNNKIGWGRRYFKAVPALAEIAQHLCVPITTPVMHLEQMVYNEVSCPIEYSNVWINSDRYSIVSILSR